MIGPTSSKTRASVRDGGMSHPRLAGLAIVVVWFTIGGIAHFVFTEKEMRIVPDIIPWPRAVVLIAGVFELLGAAGLLVKSARRAAGMGLFALTIAVTPAHFYMLRHPELFDIPYWMLVMRIPLQGALLAVIAWSTCLFAKRAGRSNPGPCP